MSWASLTGSANGNHIYLSVGSEAVQFLESWENLINESVGKNFNCLTGIVPLHKVDDSGSLMLLELEHVHENVGGLGLSELEAIILDDWLSNLRRLDLTYDLAFARSQVFDTSGHHGSQFRKLRKSSHPS